jgi:hypothetical protein
LTVISLRRTSLSTCLFKRRETTNAITTVLVQRVTTPVSYQAIRLTISSEESPAALQARYEEAVPAAPGEQVKRLLERRAPWSEVVDLIGGAAPHGFLIYNKFDAGSGMRLAGHDATCISYLMGNQLIAERMFRYEPAVMLYAPLHTVIWGSPDGPAHVTLDRPSDQFASFGRPEIAEVGRELNRKVAVLLAFLGLSVPNELRDV